MNRMALACLMLVTGCTRPDVVELPRYSLDTLEGVIGRSQVSVDSATAAEGAASLRVDVVFSRGLETPLTGTNEWTTQEIPFLLEAGQNPDNVKLNLVVDGVGTVWIDDVRLMAGSR